MNWWRLKMITVEKATQQLSTLLKMYRKKRDLSCRELGKKADVSYTVLYDFEQLRAGINVLTLIKVANALEIPAEEIARAMREEVPELIVQRKKAECCGNCKHFKEWDSGFCEFLKKSTSVCEVCMKFEEE
jgi:transcriptional regulator with XRE-family HTH domain